MAWTQSDLDTLDAAITSGKKRVTFADGRTIEYQDVDKFLQLRREMKAELNAAASQVNPRRVTIARLKRPL